MTESTNDEYQWVAFGAWRCNCTMLAATRAEIPPLCPDHGRPLLDKPSMERMPPGATLGIEPDPRGVAR